MSNNTFLYCKHSYFIKNGMIRNSGSKPPPITNIDCLTRSNKIHNDKEMLK